MKKWILLGCSLVMSISAQVFASSIKHVKICDDEGGWPPYVYYEMKDGKKTNKLIGYAVDAFDYIAKKNNFTYELLMVPWKRCLDNVKNYNDEYAMLLEFSKTPEREKEFLITEAYYTTKSAVFYNKKKFKDGLNIKALGDLKKYKGCGLAGYNYTIYGYKEGELDQGTKTMDRVVAKLKEDRCDFFPEKLEIVAGFGKTGGVKIIGDPEIGYEILTMVPESPFYMAVSRKYPQADELLKMVNDTIKEMTQKGEIKKLEQKWVN